MLSRLAYFWIVWSLLLLVHESGHALGAWHEGLGVRRVTVGVGPVLWQADRAQTELVVRLLPVAGATTFDLARIDKAAPDLPDAAKWTMLGRELTTVAGGVIATLAAGMVMAGLVAMRERRSAKLWRWGRYVVADALVLTLFNFLPVPPLDGGRAVMSVLRAYYDLQLSSSALLWIQVSGLVVSVVPMLLWTRWTARIDALVLRWGAPPSVGR